jgi:galactokinase
MKPRRRFRAPGRANLIGEHTDYAGGLVLPAAIGLAIELEGVASEQTALSSDVAGVERYAAAVEAELAELGRPPVGFTGRVTSTLPVGAGLSSSAALEVAVALALCSVAEFELAPLPLAQAAQRAEHRASGVPCGILDQAACVLGRAGHAILLDTATLEHRAVPLPAHVVIAILDSGVRRRLADSSYGARRRELEEALAGVRSPLHERRLRHLTTENERVQAVVAALEAAPVDLDRLGALFRAGHESLRDDFEVSTPELDLLVDLAYEHGARAARMTGGGFGGSIVVLADAVRADELVARVAADYTARTGITAATYVTAAADGARET